MKKLLTSILILMFFLISCGSSKKTENDADILPDEDEINDDTQANPCENIENSDGSIVDPIYIGQVGIECGCIEGYFWAYENCVSPCDPNPCENDKNSTGKCAPLSFDSHSCGCNEGYFWDGKKCSSPCDPNPCENDKNSTGKCAPLSFDSHSCGCNEGYFWDGKKCSSPCDPNPCENDEHSTGECAPLSVDSHNCGCNEGYFWDGENCIQNPCNDDPCKNHEHSDNKCVPRDKIRYTCGCEEGFWWWGQNKGCIERKPNTANICTGQTKCYNKSEETDFPAEGEDFFGQDAYYADMGFCAPHNFSIDDSVENEKTVIDNNTGLEWQQTFYGTIADCHYPCTEAVDYCENLNYGGHDNWRLPTILELHTIVDNGKRYPAINTDYFPNTPPEYFITSSSSITLEAAGGPHNSYQDGTRKHWSVDFSTGISKMHIKSYVRCVRGEKLPNKDFDVFVGSNKKDAEIAFNSNGTLIWQAGTKSYIWQNALKYCENLKLGGLSDWRLPNKNELLEYFTPCNSYSASYYAAYWITYNSSSYHWSSTTVYDKPENAWIVDYGNCLGYAHYDSFQDKTDSYLIHTRCVTDNPCPKGEIWNGETCVKENPCEPNPCSDQSYSTKTCIISTKETTGYFCECSENAFWSSDEKRCIRTCGGTNPCIYYSNSDQKCYEDEKGEFYCGCKEGYLWDSSERKCLKNAAYNDNDNEMSDADSDSSETPDIDTDNITVSDTDIAETPDETNDDDGE